MTVRAFKLSNGMEIFGKVEADDGGVMAISDAVIAIIQQTGQNESSLRFVPVSPLAKGQAATDIKLRWSAVAFEYTPEEEYASGYTTAVSGLIIAR